MTTTEITVFVIVFTLAFSLTLLLIPVCDRWGRRAGIVSRAGGRRVNEGDLRGVSKLGGLALFAGFTVTVLVAQFLPVPRFDPNEVVRLAGLVIGGVVRAVVRRYE